AYWHSNHTRSGTKRTHDLRAMPLPSGSASWASTSGGVFPSRPVIGKGPSVTSPRDRVTSPRGNEAASRAASALSGSGSLETRVLAGSGAAFDLAAGAGATSSVRLGHPTIASAHESSAAARTPHQAPRIVDRIGNVVIGRRVPGSD